MRTVTGLQGRYAPEVRYARDLVRDGYLGDVLGTTMVGSGWSGAALTALNGPDHLALKPRSRLVVTGAAGAVGGYAVQLAKVAGHEVLVDAAPEDRLLVRSLGADEVVERGPGLAGRIRAVWPDSADAVLDAAVIGPALLPAVRRGGSLVYVRSRPDQAEFDRQAATHGVALVLEF